MKPTTKTRMSLKHLFLLMLIFLASAQLYATSKPVTIATLAYRSKEETLAMWEPFIQALNHAIPQEHFELKVYTLKELNVCVNEYIADFIITNPGHYTLLKKRYNLPIPLATVVSAYHEMPLSEFGGVIFTRASTTTIKTLKDLKGKTVALTGDESLGGYQLQAYELLLLGLTFPYDMNAFPTGMPHDGVVEAVLSGKTDVGFVRTGVLEAMQKEGKLSLSELTILNEQRYEGFPLKISTQRYPEWPLVAMPHVPPSLANKVTAAALLLDSKAFEKNAMVQGFRVASDYSGVEEILRALRFSPFDTLPMFDIKEIKAYYQTEIMLFLIALFTFLLAGLAYLWRLNTHTKASQKKFKALLEGSFSALIIHEKGIVIECSQHIHTLFPSSKKCFEGMDLRVFIEPACLDSFEKAISSPYPICNVQAIRSDGRRFEMRIESKEILHEGLRQTISEWRDITEEKKTQEKLILAASVFTYAREAIIITKPNGAIIDVNQAFSAITGYTKEEALGQNPAILKSGRHEASFYQKMWSELFEKGHWYGEVWNRRRNGEMYVEMLTISAIKDERNIIKHFVAIFSDITALKENEDKLDHLAHHDALTGLPNRLLLSDRLHQAIAQTHRTASLLGVAYLDLDGFKEINDHWGHTVGDKVLVSLSNFMTKTLREGDTLARLGGDEFVIVLQNLESRDHSIAMLNRLLQAASSPVGCGGSVVNLSASIGVTFYPQSTPLEADQLLRQADQAMYQAKLSGRNRYHFFDEKADKDIQGVHESLEHIRQALENKEFVLYFQPKVNMRTAELIGVEALIRWMHPQKGLLAPGVFLPIIEDHPLAIDVGKWVIETALESARIWKRMGHEICISVNVGARQLQSADFTEFLSKTLRNFPDISPSNLKLEIVETSALQDIYKTTTLIKKFQELGIGFALDDFGTGYSSLSYLKKLPVEILKIDQSFVFDMLEDTNDLSILEGVIGLAKAFHHRVIAEGVETQEHGRMLLYLGCELAQGFGIARPMPLSELLSWKATWKPYESWVQTKAIRRRDYPVVYAMVEHRAWIKAFERYLKQESGVPPSLSEHQCNFGQWLDKQEATRKDIAVLQSIVTLHAHIHQDAKEIATQKLTHHALEKKQMLMHASSDDLIEALHALLQEC